MCYSSMEMAPQGSGNSPYKIPINTPLVIPPDIANLAFGNDRIIRIEEPGCICGRHNAPEA